MTLPTDIPFSGTLIPAGLFPGGYANQNQGGFQTRTDLAELNAIPTHLRVPGMHVRVGSETYILISSENSGNISDWQLLVTTGPAGIQFLEVHTPGVSHNGDTTNESYPKIAVRPGPNNYAYFENDGNQAGTLVTGSDLEIATVHGDFVQPTIGNTVLITVRTDDGRDDDVSTDVRTASFLPGMAIVILQGGYYQIVEKPTGTAFLLRNLGGDILPGIGITSAFKAAGETVQNSSQIIHSGFREAPPVVAAGGKRILCSVNFATLPNQDLKVGGDGDKTMGGLVYPIFGTANLSEYAVVNGTGIRFTLGSNTAGFAVGMGFRFDNLIANALDKPYCNRQKMTVSFQYSVPSLNTGEIFLGEWGEITGYGPPITGTMRAGMLMANGGGSGYAMRYTDPPGTSGLQSIGLNTSNASDDCTIITVQNASLAEVSTGVYGPSWPRATRLRGWRQHPSNINEWITRGNSQNFDMLYISAAGGLGRQFILKKFEVAIWE